MFTHLIRSLTKAGDRLRARIPNEVVNIYAFGSRVRGDHGDNSDLDILVVVQARTMDVEQAVIDVFFEEEMRNGITIEPTIKEFTSFELERKHHSPFYENVVTEGIAI